MLFVGSPSYYDARAGLSTRPSTFHEEKESVGLHGLVHAPATGIGTADVTGGHNHALALIVPGDDVLDLLPRHGAEAVPLPVSSLPEHGTEDIDASFMVLLLVVRYIERVRWTVVGVKVILKIYGLGIWDEK